MKKLSLFLFVLLFTSLRAAAAGGPAEKVDISTATGDKITFDAQTGLATIEGNARVYTSTGTIKADMIRFNTQTKVGRAEGNVEMKQSSSTMTGDVADYYYESGTGTVHGASGMTPPWRFTAEEIKQINPNFFALEDCSITSCELDPPHYRITAHRGTLRPGKRIKLYGATFVAEDTPSFYMPFYTRSLVPKKYKLRIEPGHTSRDGTITKTTLSYPFTEHTWTSFRWDYLQKTGDGFGLLHTYDLPNIKGNFDSYYIRDTNPDVEVPQSRRYTILWNHYERLTPRLTINGKLDIKSDQSFGNQFTGVGNQVLVENQQRGLLSEGGFAYQFPLATVQAQFSRQDKFDSNVSSHQFISHLTLPALTFNTAPLTGKHFPFYTSFSGSFTNDTIDRSDPRQSLLYKKNVVTSAEMKKDIRLKNKTWTFTPIGTYSQTWNDRVATSSGVSTEKDQYIGRYSTGLDARRRFFRLLDFRIGYRYGGRNRVNQTRQDITADDFGVETNQLNTSVQTRVGRNTLVTLASGYDYRDDPRSLPGKYKHSSARVTPPSLDLQVEAKKNVNLFFRETYSIYDSGVQRVIRTPVNTSGEIQLGAPNAATSFSHGFSFSKSGADSPSQLFLTDKLKFYLTSKWYVDLFVSYRAVGDRGLDYRKAFPIERTIRVVRDLHCWVLRGQFSQRPGVSEASFYVDLKTNVTSSSSDLFKQANSAVYSTRNDGPDLGQIFPEPPPTQKPSSVETK